MTPRLCQAAGNQQWGQLCLVTLDTIAILRDVWWRLL